MKLKIVFDPDLVALMEAEIAAGEKAVSAAMREVCPEWQAHLGDFSDASSTKFPTRLSRSRGSVAQIL